MKTTHEYRGYVFTVTYEAKDPAYVVDFPDIADIITSGETLGEAFNNRSGSDTNETNQTH